MNTRLLSFFVILVFLAGCGPKTAEPTLPPTASPQPTATLAEPEVQTTRPPDAVPAVQAYLDAWRAENYPAMYALLTPISQEAISLEDFEARYRSVAAEASLSNWDYEILSTLTATPQSAQAAYRVILDSVLVGEIVRETVMNLTLEEGQWRIQWDDAIILPELVGGNTLRMDIRSPSRANIYDRNGSALVAQADAVAIGLATGKVNPDTQDALLNELYRITGIRPERLLPTLESYRANNWYLPVADVSVDELAPRYDVLTSYEGVLLSQFRSRYYFSGGIAPHVVGYVSAIQAEEIERYKRLGYNVYSDRVGQAGIEFWGEEYLSGKRGGTLYLVSPDGAIITRLAESTAQPAQAVYTTLDKNLQLGVQQAMSKYRGAIVVIERDTGRLLAMASSPGFNPNLFEPTNVNSAEQIGSLFDLDRLPLLNRAAQGQYPLGSVFKIVTTAAALESGLYTSQSELNCGYFFSELQGVTLNDWTYDHFLEDGKTQPSGQLTLPQGLMRSCNPWFWHIGLDFYNRSLYTTISDMARNFGLGSNTGIEISEQAGQIPDPTSQLDATNLAIGQGNMQVTPLQVASFIAAVGNGGNLLVPTAIDKIVSVDGMITQQFTTTLRSTLPVSPANLEIIQNAMYSVVNNSRGTAYSVLNGFSNSYRIPIAGKTGTAQSGAPDPHAWFGGYTNAGRQDRPDIAVVVLAEYGGEGSEVAAPIFKRVMEIYFLGKPQTRYPWESQIGVIATPEPTETPEP